MTENYINKSDHLIKKWIQRCCFFIITLASFVLVSWFIEKPFLAGFSYSYVPMAPSTAVVFILLSVSITLISYENISGRKCVLALSALIISFIISSLLLVLSYNGIRSPYEHIFISLPDEVQNLVIGHMSPLTAASFLFAIASIYLTLFFAEDTFFKKISGIMAVAVFFNGTILCLGYIYRSPFLYGTEVIPVALTTSIGFIVLGIALILLGGVTVFPLKLFGGDALDIGDRIDNNITERRRAEDELTTANSELMAVNRIVTACSSILDLKDILGKILDEAISITGMDGGSICLLNTENKLIPVTFRNLTQGIIEDFRSHQIKLDECSCGQCEIDHKPLILADRKAMLEYSCKEALIGGTIYFNAAYPLITGTKSVGVLCVFSRSDKKPSDRALRLIETVTPQIAMTIERSRLYEEVLSNTINLEKHVAMRTRELEEANLQLKELDHLKSVFIASVSHELRTPLNAVIGFSSILVNHWVGPLNEEQKDLLNSILKSERIVWRYV